MDSITIEVAKENKFLCLVGPHPIGVICPDKNKILVGRGSIGLLNNVHYYHQKIQEQPVLQIGNFCESTVDCTILVGGEHDNHSAWNLVYAGLPVMAQLVTSSIGHPMALSKGSTTIESNVVLSKGCLVVSGSRIGQGAVIAANAVVAGNVAPKTIWIGNPGCGRPRFFGKRTEEEIYDLIDWNQVCVADLLELESWVRNADREALQRYFDAQDPAPNRRLWFNSSTRARKIEIKDLIGATIDDSFIKPSQFPKAFVEYLNQANDDNPSVNWVPDAFKRFW